MSEDSKEADEKNNNKKQVSKKIVGKKYSVNMFQRSKHTQHLTAPDSTQDTNTQTHKHTNTQTHKHTPSTTHKHRPTLTQTTSGDVGAQQVIHFLVSKRLQSGQATGLRHVPVQLPRVQLAEAKHNFHAVGLPFQGKKHDGSFQKMPRAQGQQNAFS
jgi:hypothetical protein